MQQDLVKISTKISVFANNSEQTEIFERPRTKQKYPKLMSYIKNIIKIETVRADDLNTVVFPSRHQCIIPTDVVFGQIYAKSPSSCEITDKIESKVRIFTSKLTFKTFEQIDCDAHPLAFRVTTADGCRYLIGRPQRPYPVVTRSETMPGSMTDTSLITYTVQWSDVLKPLLCVE